MAGILRTRERRIHRVSLPCRAAVGTTTEISPPCPATDGGGPPPSCPGPMPGTAPCTATPVASPAPTTTVHTVSRFAAAGIRVVRRGIRPFDHCHDRREVASVAEELN